MTNEELIVERFKAVRDKGFVPSNRHHNTGIGKTFEDYMNVAENNLDAPDLLGYEIKSHREKSQSYITLFTKSPSFPKQANAFLKDTFGIPYKDNPNLKSLHTSMFAHRYNTFFDKFSFKLINNRQSKTLYIGVYSQNDKELIDKQCGYYYSDLEIIFKKKIKKLFYVTADTRIKNGQEYFHYTNADIYENPSFDRFLKLIDEGQIMYDIRIGSYQSGDKYGKAHDHGSGFRILEPNLTNLFDNHIQI